MKKLLQTFKKMSLFARITAATVLIVCATFIILNSLTISIFSNMVLEKEVLLGKEALRKIQIFTEEKYNRAYNLSNFMHASGNIANLFAAINNDNDLAYDYSIIGQINNYLLSINISDPDISEYILVAKHGPVYTTPVQNSRVVSPSFNFIDYDPIRKLLSSDTSMVVVRDTALPYINREGESVIDRYIPDC